MRHKLIVSAIFTASLSAAASIQAADEPSHEAMHMNHAMMRGEDTRELVRFPAPLLEHTMANMRDHLLTLARIQAYLSKHEFDKAGTLAEERLGMSSLGLHGAHEVAPYMPKGMQEAGTAMHRAASRFAVATQEAAIDNDVGRALGALNEVTQACVACHAAYRLR